MNGAYGMSKYNLKDMISTYYEQEDEKILDDLANALSNILISKSLKTPDIDKLCVCILKKPDSIKFKHYILDKHDNDVKCEICSIKERLELHHLKKVASYPELKYDENNVCFLCESCHSLVHHGGGGASKIEKPLKNKIQQVFKVNLNRNLDKNKSNLLQRVTE
jgi:hypothetical protein